MRTLALLACLVLPALSWAGTIVITIDGSPLTITTTAAQDAALIRLKARENRGNPVPPLTTEQYVRQVLVGELSARVTEASTVEQASFCTVFPTLTPAQRTNIISLGGGASPCP